MKTKLFTLIIMCAALSSWAIWVPSSPSKSSPDNISFQQEGVWSPPGYSNDSLYTWVEIPDVGTTILPPIAQSTKASAQSSQASNVRIQAIDNKVQEDQKNEQREATIPRFNDVSADVEYGIISFKPKFGSKISGYGISAKARYEMQPNDNFTLGARVDNEYTKYKFTDVSSITIPGNDFLLLGAIFRMPMMTDFEIGAQGNVSLFFRSYKKFDQATMKTIDVNSTDWALNPMFYGIYNYSFHHSISGIGPISGYGGAFAGLTYSTFSYAKYQLPYAAIGSIGTTFGQHVATQIDAAVSHQFLILGAQAPIYLTRLFSLTLGIKYPFLFQASNLSDFRMTLGASTRF
jgi:hypothetical protein